MYIKKLTKNVRVHHSIHGLGTVVGAHGDFARVMFDKDRHEGAAAVKEVHHRNLSVHHDG